MHEYVHTCMRVVVVLSVKCECPALKCIEYAFINLNGCSIGNLDFT